MEELPLPPEPQLEAFIVLWNLRALSDGPAEERYEHVRSAPSSPTVPTATDVLDCCKPYQQIWPNRLAEVGHHVQDRAVDAQSCNLKATAGNSVLQLHAAALVDKHVWLRVQTGHQAADMVRAAGAVDVARMSLVVHANLESEEQVDCFAPLARI